MRDPRSEIAFLRKYLDRRGNYVFVFDKARRLAKEKVARSPKPIDTSTPFDTLEQLKIRIDSAFQEGKLTPDLRAILDHVVTLGWENGTRLITILRLELFEIESNIDQVVVSVVDKNSGGKRISLNLKVCEETWNAAARIPVGRWPKA